MKLSNNSWQIKTFDEIFELKQGKHLPLDELNGGAYPVFGANGMVGFYNKFMYERATLLVTCRGATCGSINLTEPNSWVTGNAIALVPKEDIVNSFFYYQLKNQSFSDVISGSAQPQIIVGLLKNKKVIVPPLPIQKQIAEILEKADGAKQKRKEANKLTDEFLQSVFIEMFGDPVKNPKRFSVDTLEKVCLKITDGTHNSPKNDESGAYKYITAKNIKKDGFDLRNITYISKSDHKAIYSRCNPEFEDILYIKDGVTTGIAQVNTFHDEFSMLSSLALFKLNKLIINPYYLRDYLNNGSVYQSIRNSMGGAAITRLTIDKLKRIKAVVPPLAIQQQYAEIVNKTEALKEKQKQSEQELENLFQSLMQRAFNGELVC